MMDEVAKIFAELRSKGRRRKLKERELLRSPMKSKAVRRRRIKNKVGRKVRQRQRRKNETH